LKSDDFHSSRSRLIAAERTGFFLEDDYETVEAILCLRDATQYITRQTVRYIALAISQREKIGELNASDGWLSRCMETNKFSFRRVKNSLLYQIRNCCIHRCYNHNHKIQS